MVKLTKIALYMGKMHNFSRFVIFACASAVKYGGNGENVIINGNVAVKWKIYDFLCQKYIPKISSTPKLDLFQDCSAKGHPNILAGHALSLFS